MPHVKVGLALGSGVARGWAHIGIIQTLLDAGIVPDIIAGTSIGALVGGLYLGGQLQALDDWSRGLSRLKITRYLDFQFGGGGLITGRRLTDLLERTVGGIHIQDLSHPFVAIATDLVTGREIWLREGKLIDAMRASYALPGLFTPIEIDGRWLVDGALVNPVPVSVCRRAGAEVVIAVDLNADNVGRGVPGNGRSAIIPPEDEKEIADAMPRGRVADLVKRQFFGSRKSTPSLFEVMVGSLNVLQNHLSRSRLAGDPPDILMTPRLGHVGLLDFHRADEIIAEGNAAAERALTPLRNLLGVT